MFRNSIFFFRSAILNLNCGSSYAADSGGNSDSLVLFFLLHIDDQTSFKKANFGYLDSMIASNIILVTGGKKKNIV